MDLLMVACKALLSMQLVIYCSVLLNCQVVTLLFKLIPSKLVGP